jgi:hypothetical protein
LAAIETLGAASNAAWLQKRMHANNLEVERLKIMSAFLAGKPEQGIKLFALMTFLMLAMFLRCKTVGWDGHVGTSYYAVSG